MNEEIKEWLRDIKEIILHASKEFYDKKNVDNKCNLEEKPIIELLNQNRNLYEQFLKYNVNVTESYVLNELYTALAKAQGEMEIAKMDSSNPFFRSKYADLSSIVRASRPYLTKNGLSVVQRLMTRDGKSYLNTRLCHASGQWISSELEVNPPKPGIQELGKEITYIRRYMYASICGVIAADEDDDGESAMYPHREKKKEENQNGFISRAQMQILSQELEGEPELLQSILKGYKINKLAELPEKVYTVCLNKIKEIKRAKE